MNPFLDGFLRAFDIFAVIPNPEIERILARTDEEAIASDWQAVGDDLRKAMVKLERENMK